MVQDTQILLKILTLCTNLFAKREESRDMKKYYVISLIKMDLVQSQILIRLIEQLSIQKC